eukprot:scaffold7432_cov107-Isochrysis_galbana.AAC.12
MFELKLRGLSAFGSHQPTLGGVDSIPATILAAQGGPISGFKCVGAFVAPATPAAAIFGVRNNSPKSSSAASPPSPVSRDSTIFSLPSAVRPTG